MGIQIEITSTRCTINASLRTKRVRVIKNRKRFGESGVILTQESVPFIICFSQKLKVILLRMPKLLSNLRVKHVFVVFKCILLSICFYKVTAYPDVADDSMYFLYVDNYPVRPQDMNKDPVCFQDVTDDFYYRYDANYSVRSQDVANYCVRPIVVANSSVRPRALRCERFALLKREYGMLPGIRCEPFLRLKREYGMLPAFNSCEAPVVEEGHMATITFYFLSNVENDDVRIFKDDAVDSVLTCAVSNNKRVLEKNDFYDSDCEIKDNKLTVIINETQKYHAGNYGCLTDLSWNNNVKTCTLEVREKDKSSDTYFSEIDYVLRVFVVFIIGFLIVICIVCYRCPKSRKCCLTVFENMLRRLEHSRSTHEHTEVPTNCTEEVLCGREGKTNVCIDDNKPESSGQFSSLQKQ